MGFPVVDVKCSLKDGGFHPVDSSAIAFEIAARACFKEGAGKAKPIVMEPIMKVQWFEFGVWNVGGNEVKKIIQRRVFMLLHFC